jgi:predicted CxxxxCH...CXXCH cytochrome family protein
MNVSITPAAQLRVVALFALTGALAVLGACEVVEPGPMAHTAPTTGPTLVVGGELTGRHSQIACEACHVGQLAPFGPVADNCLGCHAADRSLNFRGDDHYPDAKTCNDGCHRVVDYCWAEVYGGPCVNGPITETDTDTDADTDADTDVDTDTDTDTDTPTAVSCGSAAGCHGPTRPDAAPADGSHSAHLDGPTDLWAPAAGVSCDTCHPAGTDLTTPTHANGTIELPMAGIAVGANPSPTFSGGTCSGTYCHGAQMADGGYAPVWNGGPSEADCGSCHGIGPTLMVEDDTHPPIANCAQCHAPTTGSYGDALTDPTTHIDGLIQAP